MGRPLHATPISPGYKDPQIEMLAPPTDRPGPEPVRDLSRRGPGNGFAFLLQHGTLEL
jgi:hypothetical protein